MASNWTVSRRSVAPSYSNQAYVPDISIVPDQPTYSVGGACALGTTKILSYESESGVSLHPTPFYKNFKGISPDPEEHKAFEAERQGQRCCCCVCITILIIIVLAISLGLGLGLGLAPRSVSTGNQPPGASH